MSSSKTIFLKKLELRNFKGNQHAVFEFQKESSLYGDNGTGKTTVGADALPWLFFGKNSADETKFNVKTLDSSGARIPNIETRVKAWFDINEVEEVFERVLVEKWVKKHGETTKEYTGDETKFFINAAPKKKNEFDAEIGNIISPALFKLLSNPNEFNRLPWDRRRDVLIKMAGNITDDKVLDSVVTAQNKFDYNDLIFALNKNGIEVYKSELKGKIKLHKDNLQNIPSRIDEVHRSKPSVLDWNDLNGQIKAKDERIDKIDTLIANEAEKQRELNQASQETQKLIGEKQLSLQKVENELTLEANKEIIKLKNEKIDLDHNLSHLTANLKASESFVIEAENSIENLKKEREILLNDYANIKARSFKFDESKSICPTCKQSLPDEDIEKLKAELLGNFNERNANDLDKNIKDGLELKVKINKWETQLKDAQDSIILISKEYPELKSKSDKIVIEEKPVDYSMNKEWNDLYNEIEALKLKIIKPAELKDNSALKIEKQELQTIIKELVKQLNTKSEIEKSDLRIAELQKQQTELAQNIADLEKQENIVDKFEKTKMEMLEEKVNSMFQLVKFRMFEPQKNGGEKPDCVTLINGVPYSDANTASKINAGIDIINVLSEHYKIYVPLVVDNRESVTKLLRVKTQIINLIKDENYKSLTLK